MGVLIARSTQIEIWISIDLHVKWFNWSMAFPKILKKLQKSLDYFLPNIKSEPDKSYHLSIPNDFEVMDNFNPAELIT
jgi:hypothetical protein